MAWYYNRFGEMIKKAFVGRTKKTMDEAREKRQELISLRNQRFEDMVAPLDADIQAFDEIIRKSCEHPKEFVSIKVEGWHNDDGEGNSWSGDTVIVKCMSCGFHEEKGSNSDRSHGDRFTEPRISRSDVNLNSIWKQLTDEIDQENAKRRAQRQEEDERATLARLQKKYGKEA